MEASSPVMGRARLFLAVLMGVLPHLLAAGLVIACSLVLARDLGQARVPGPADLLLVLGAGVAVAGLVLLRGSGGARGMPIEATTQPGLVSLVEQVAGRLGCGVPSRIRLVPHAGIDTVARVILPGVTLHRELHIGMALIHQLEAGQLRALLAYQLTRWAHRGTLRAWLCRLHDHLERWVLETPRAFWTLPCELYARSFLRLARPVSLHERRAADVRAAATVGNRLYARSLLRVFSVSQRFALYLRKEILALVAAGGLPDNIYAGFGAWLESTGHRIEDAESFDDIRAATGKMADALPVTSSARAEIVERQDRIERLSAVEPWPDTRPARELLSDPEADERKVTPFVVRLFRRQGFSRLGREPERVGWDEVENRIIIPQQRARTRHVLRVLGQLASHEVGMREGIELYLQFLEGRDMRDRLALRLDPGMNNLPPGVYRILVQGIHIRFLGTLVGAALTEDRGFRWSKPIGKPLTLEGAQGEHINPFEMVQDLLEGRLDVRNFRMQLFEHGLFGGG